MAESTLGYSPLKSYIAIASEATFGTAIADDQVFTILKTVGTDTPPFVPTSFTDDTMRNNGTNAGDVNDYY